MQRWITIKDFERGAVSKNIYIQRERDREKKKKKRERRKEEREQEKKSEAAQGACTYHNKHVRI